MYLIILFPAVQNHFPYSQNNIYYGWSNQLSRKYKHIPPSTALGQPHHNDYLINFRVTLHRITTLVVLWSKVFELHILCTFHTGFLKFNWSFRHQLGDRYWKKKPRIVQSEICLGKHSHLSHLSFKNSVSSRGTK